MKGNGRYVRQKRPRGARTKNRQLSDLNFWFQFEWLQSISNWRWRSVSIIHVNATPRRIWWHFQWLLAPDAKYRIHASIFLHKFLNYVRSTAFPRLLCFLENIITIRWSYRCKFLNFDTRLCWLLFYITFEYSMELLASITSFERS